jgi:hypothetical protein
MQISLSYYYFIYYFICFFLKKKMKRKRYPRRIGGITEVYEHTT